MRELRLGNKFALLAGIAAAVVNLYFPDLARGDAGSHRIASSGPAVAGQETDQEADQETDRFLITLTDQESGEVYYIPLHRLGEATPDTESPDTSAPGPGGSAGPGGTPGANGAPAFAEGATATRSVAENSPAETNVGAPVAATDPNRDPLTYSLSGTDAASFGVSSATGQITTRAGVTYDYETKQSYSLTVEVSDGKGGTASIAVTVNLTDVSETPRANRPPVFSLAHFYRTVPLDTTAGVKVGDTITATDPDGDTLTYSMSDLHPETQRPLTNPDETKGVDAFNLDSATGQLTTSPGVTYDFNAQAEYALTITATDPYGATDSARVRVDLSNPSKAPVFTDGPRSFAIDENSPAGTVVGTVTATHDDVIRYVLITPDRVPPPPFSIDANGQMTVAQNVSLNYEGKRQYTFDVVAMDANDRSPESSQVAVSVNINDVDEAPAFGSSSYSFSILSTIAVGGNVGTPVSATDPEGETVTYSLSGADATSFNLNTSTGQLTAKSGVTYSPGDSYALAVTAADPNRLSSTIAVTVSVSNIAPTFGASSTTRAILENQAVGAAVGDPVAATDADNDTLTYTLAGTDAASFSINASTGQISSAARFDYETEARYSVTVNVADSNGGAASISVTVNIGDIDEPPVFASASTTRQASKSATAVRLLFKENSLPSSLYEVHTQIKGFAVGAPVTATGNGTISYSITGVNPITRPLSQNRYATVLTAEEDDIPGNQPLDAPDSRAFLIDPATGQIYAPTAGIVDSPAQFGEHDIYVHYSWPWAGNTVFQVRVKACDSGNLCATTLVNITIND